MEDEDANTCDDKCDVSVVTRASMNVSESLEPLEDLGLSVNVFILLF